MIAQVSQDPTNWASILQTGGTAGLILGLCIAVVAFLRGWVVSGASHREDCKKLDDRNEALEAENREQSIFLRDKMAPLVTRSTDILGKVLEQREREEWMKRQT